MSYSHVQQLKSIRDQYDVAKAAIGFLEQSWSQLHQDERMLGLAFAGVQLTVRLLEGTYIIRLFAEFESILRLHWKRVQRRPRQSRERMELFISKVALHAHVPDDIRDATQAVRIYRNSLVHSEDERAVVHSFQQALTALNRFVAILPEV